MATLSSRQRAHLCVASEVLPRLGNVGGDFGSAGHDFLCVLIRKGREAAIDSLESIARRWALDETETSILEARCRSFRPDIPEGALAEQPLALLDDGSVVEVVGARGSYETPAGTLVAGTIDAMWSDPAPLLGHRCPRGSTLWITDWKSGEDRHVPRVEQNRQVREGALLAARWTGAETVIPSICFIEKGLGRWDVGEPLRAADFEEIEREIREDKAREERQRRKRDAGEPLDYVTGPHCEYCPARRICPPRVAEVRALVTGSMYIDGAELTANQARKLAELLSPATAVLQEVRSALIAHVEAHGLIELDDGRVWGPDKGTKDRIDTTVAFDLLASEIGEEQARAAFKTSKTAIDEAIKGRLRAQGIKRQGAPRVREFYAELLERGGLTKEEAIEWRVHHPAPKETP